MGQNKNKKIHSEKAEGRNRQNPEEKRTEREIEEKEDRKLEEYGQITLENNRGNRKIQLLTIIGEVEGGHADLARGAAQGQVDREHEVSLCPTCGAVYFGRRPAFCTICNQPNFEMERMRRGVLD